MKYFLIAGEASGDLHGAALMDALKVKDTGAEFRYFGGDRMQQQGGILLKHYREMAFMGGLKKTSISAKVIFYCISPT